jgi:hypothetical protein
VKGEEYRNPVSTDHRLSPNARRSGNRDSEYACRTAIPVYYSRWEEKKLPLLLYDHRKGIPDLVSDDTERNFCFYY